MYKQIQTFKRQGYSRNKIAMELEINPRTAAKYYKMDEDDFRSYRTEHLFRDRSFAEYGRLLKQLLELNEVINTVLILKDKLKHIWSYKSRTWATKAIEEWWALARCTEHPSVQKFADTLEQYSYGILNHCDYPILTGKLEGVNNKIKVIKRKAYGYHDLRYFSLEIIQAFTN